MPPTSSAATRYPWVGSNAAYHNYTEKWSGDHDKRIQLRNRSEYSLRETDHDHFLCELAIGLDPS